MQSVIVGRRNGLSTNKTGRGRVRMAAMGVALTLCVIGTMTADAVATPGTWTGASGLWSDTANWSGGVVADDKGLANIADFSTLALSADQTVNLDSYRLIGGLKFGDTDGTPNNWTVDNNGVAGNKIQLEGDGYNGAGRPTIEVVNGTATISASIVEGSSPNHQWIKKGDGTLVLTGLVTGVGGFVIQGGTSAGAASTVTFNNPALSVGTTNTANNYFGYQNITIAQSTGEFGVLNLQAGTLNTSALQLAGDGSNGSGNATLNLSGGTLKAGGVTSASNNNSSATINITGGELAVVNNGIVDAGKFYGKPTTVNITNGKLAFYSDNGTTLGGTGGWTVGGGTSTFNLYAGGVLSSPKFTVNASGGGAGGGNGFVFFKGGTLQASAASTDFFATGLLFVRVSAGGGTIDTNGFDITMGNNMFHDPALGTDADGGLTKVGAGTLTLTHTGSTYNGPTTVNAGTLKIVDARIVSKVFNIASGATLEFNRNTVNDYQLASSITGAGTLLKTGAANTRFSDTPVNVAMSPGGLIDVQGGVLQAADFNTTADWSLNKGDLHIASGAMFDALLADVVVDKLTGDGTYQAGWYGPRNLTVGANDGSSTFAGVIKDNLAGGSAAVTVLNKTGTGTLTLTGNNTFTGGVNVKGGAVGAPSTLTISPATTATIGGALNMSTVTGAVTALDMTGGTFNCTGGQVGQLGTATVSLSGTAALNLVGNLTLSQNDHGGATVNIDGTAQINLQNNTKIFMGAFFNRPTTINQNGGTVTAYSDTSVTPGGTGGLVINGGASTYNLNGGTLSIPAVLWTSAGGGQGGGSGTFKFNGGTLVTSAPSADFFPTGHVSLVAQAGGGTINTAGNAVTINNAITHDPALGGVDGGITKSGAGDLTLNGTNTYTGKSTVLDGKLILTNPAQSTVFSGGGAHLEGNSARLVLDYTGSGSPATTLRGILAASLAGNFTGTQLSTNAAGNIGLGWIDNSATSQITIRRTVRGDSNLDLTVNFDDLLALAQNYNGPTPKTWEQGDFNYDGAVEFADLLVLAQNYNGSALTGEFTSDFASDWALAQSLVPEPATLVTLAGVFAMLGGRRRTARQAR